MRWKLLGLVSIIAALTGVAIWSATIIAAFGSAGTMARHDWMLLASFLIPLGLTVFGSLFVYRHTAHRRKSQVLISTLLTLALTCALYLVAAKFFKPRLDIPGIYGTNGAR